MLALNKNFEDSRAIRVLVVPIGENSQFDSQFEIVSRRRFIPMYELNKPSSDVRSASTPFKNINWQSGSLVFDYLRYDRVATTQGDSDTFQCYKRYLHVIGLINYPELVGSKYRLEEDMDYYTRRYPNVILRRYFIFNMFVRPTSDVWAIPSIPNDPNAIVVFPPEGECEGGNSMIDVHLQEVMADVALHIWLALESQAAICDDTRTKLAGKIPSGMNLFTIYDELEDGVADVVKSTGNILNAVANPKLKKRIGGRLRKVMGDLCMQACTPSDALENFQYAITECKNQNDHMWLAGAYEGYAASILLCLELKINVEELLGRDLKNIIQSGKTLEGAVVKLAEDKCVEALSLYSRSLTFAGFEVECCLRLTKMLESSQASSPDKEQKVIEYLLRAIAVPGLNRQQQMECTLEAAFVCHRLKLQRKYAFFLYMAAMYAVDSDNAIVTSFMMKQALKLYGMKLSDEINSELGSKSDIRLDLKQSWVGIRRMLLAQCAYFSEEAGDYVSSARCLAGMLRLLGESDVKWRISSSMWLPSDFVIDDLSKLVITSTASAYSLPSIVSANNSNLPSPNGAGQRLLVKIPSDKRLHSSDRSNSVSYNQTAATYNLRSPSVSNLSGSHTMASLSKLNKANYQQLHARMRLAGGRLQDLHENISSLIEKNNVFDFSQHGDKDSEVGSDGGNTIQSFSGFSPDASGNSKNPSKRRIPVPRVETYVSGLIDVVVSSKRNGRSASVVTTATINSSSNATTSTLTRSVSYIPQQNTDILQNLNGSTVPHSNSTSALVAPSVPGSYTAESVLNTPPTPPPVINVSNNLILPQSVSSTMHATTAAATTILVAAGMVDESGLPLFGALSAASNCISKPWLGSLMTSDLNKLASIQDSCYKKMVSTCEKVNPTCNIYFGSIPSVLCMYPMEVPLVVRPFKAALAKNEKKSVTNEGGSSALYYDPFEAKRLKSKEKQKGPSQVNWIEKYSCCVSICFSNNLCVDVTLSNVSVLLENLDDQDKSDTYEVTPQEVIVPSVLNGGKCFNTTLTVFPTRPGYLKLIGVRYFIRNAMYISLIDEKGFGIKNSNEISEPWKYPRIAMRSRRQDDEYLKKLNILPLNPVSMIVDVAPAAAILRSYTSWPRVKLLTETLVDMSFSRQPKSLAVSDDVENSVLDSKLVLRLCDGELRRETITFKNMTPFQVVDACVSYSYNCTIDQTPIASKNNSAATNESDGGVLIPWSGALMHLNKSLKDKTSKKLSAKAEAAINDYNNYVAEKRRLSGVTGDQVETNDEESILPAIVRIIGIEIMDAAGNITLSKAHQDGSCNLQLPIPPFGSIQMTMEFAFRKDILCRGNEINSNEHEKYNIVAGSVRQSSECVLDINLSYLSDEKAFQSNASFSENTLSEGTNSSVYYRVNTVSSLVAPVHGIELNNMWIHSPGTACSNKKKLSIIQSACRESDGGVTASEKKHHRRGSRTAVAAGNISGFIENFEDPSNMNILQSSSVLDVLANILGKQEHEKLAVETEELTERKVCGVEIHEGKSFLIIQFSNPLSHFGLVHASSLENFPLSWVDESLRNSRCLYTSDDFLRTLACSDSSLSLSENFLLVLPPKSSRSVIIELKANLDMDSTFSAVLEKILSSLRWRDLKGGIALNFADNTKLSSVTAFEFGRRSGKITRSKITPEIIDNARKLLATQKIRFIDSNIEIGGTLDGIKKNLVSWPYVCSSSDNLLSKQTLHPCSVHIKYRNFYSFSAKICFVNAEYNSSNPHIILEIAVIVVEGHHIGIMEKGSGLSEGRVGVTEVNPLVAADSKNTSSVTINDSFRRDGPQSGMLCPNVVASGQLRKLYKVSIADLDSKIYEHSIKLCFTRPDSYTVFTLAREVKSGSYSHNSSWKLNSNPLLVTVSVQ